MKIWRKRAVDAAREGDGWQTRAITLIHDRAATQAICEDWEAAGWVVIAVDPGPDAHGQAPTHVVRVAVPPPGWSSLEQEVALLDQRDSSA